MTLSKAKLIFTLMLGSFMAYIMLMDALFLS